MKSLLIMGAGVSGSYLYAEAKNEFNITVYEMNPQRRGHNCGWATFIDKLQECLSKVNLRADDYVKNKLDEICVNGIRLPVRGQAIIDKPRLLQDLLPEKQITPAPIDPTIAEGKGLVVNATNVPFGIYKSIPAVQHAVHVKGLEPNINYFYVNPRKAGYAWLFPLDDEGKEWHVGANVLNGSPMNLLQESYKFYKIIQPDKLICSCGRSINVVLPGEAQILGNNGAVSVGEAAGVVSPLSGEGMVPSMESVDVFYRIAQSGMSLAVYEDEMRRRLFDNIGRDHAIWEKMKVNPRMAWADTFRYALEKWEVRGHVGLFQKLRAGLEILIR